MAVLIQPALLISGQPLATIEVLLHLDLPLFDPLRLEVDLIEQQVRLCRAARFLLGSKRSCSRAD